MAVPEDIRKVPRQVNTIVEDNGREGPNHYAVRERHSVKYTRLLDEMSYGELMDDLNSAWRKVDGTFPARSDDDFWVHTLANVFEALEALGLSIPIPKPGPKKRERKPKSTDQAELKPKRPRERPRKNPISSAGSL